MAEEIISQVYPLQFSSADNRETSKSPSSTSPGPVRSEAGTLVDSEAEDPIEFGVVNLLARVKTAWKVSSQVRKNRCFSFKLILEAAFYCFQVMYFIATRNVKSGKVTTSNYLEESS